MPIYYYDGTGTIPENTTRLYCSSNHLTSLPPLPEGLQELNCYWNQLTSLPSLPESLNVLQCYNNQLTSLPTLPKSLRILLCNDNQLTTLPPLPEGLQILHFNSNHLTSLPPLPEGLRILYCDNYLVSLPEETPTKNKIDIIRKLQFEEYKKREKENNEKILKLEELVKEKEGIIEEMMLIPGYGKYYQQAKERFEERVKSV